jgi:anaphase-promoting complex subunit 8
VKEMRAELCYLAHVLQKVDKFHPATCSVIGNYYSLKRNHERAIIYFQRALKLNPDFSSAWTLMGHEYVELRNANAAVHCYRQAVKFTPGCHSNDYRAWYGLGQAYEMLHLFGYALFYYDKAASLRPTDARMWCAVGKCLYKLSSSGSGLGASLTGSNAWANQRYAALLAYERAVQCGDSEGVATRELAKMYREFGNKPSAALCYVKYLALQDRLNARSHDDVEDQFAEGENLIYIYIYTYMCIIHVEFHYIYIFIYTVSLRCTCVVPFRCHVCSSICKHPSCIPPQQRRIYA